MPYEKDTDEEKALSAALYRHFENNVPIDVKFADLLEYLLEQGWYDAIITEPSPGTIVMRGMNASTKWLKSITGLSDRDITDPMIDSWEGEFDFTPKRQGSSSWTDDIKTATSFARWGSAEAPLTIIIYADSDDNQKKFISCENGLYKLDKISKFSIEKEIIGLGTIKCFKVEWH